MTAVFTTPTIVTDATQEFPLIIETPSKSQIRSFVIQHRIQLKLTSSVQITELRTARLSDGGQIFYKRPQEIVNVGFHFYAVNSGPLREVVPPDNYPSGSLFSRLSYSRY